MEAEEGIVEIPDDDLDDEDLDEEDIDDELEEEEEEEDDTKVTEEDMFKKQSPRPVAIPVMKHAHRVLEPGEVVDDDDLDDDDDEDDDDDDEEDDDSLEDDDEDEEEADSYEDMAGSADSSMASEREENSNASSVAGVVAGGFASIKKTVIKLPPLPAGLTVSAVPKVNTQNPASTPEGAPPVKQRRKRATKAEMAERRAKAEAEARERLERGDGEPRKRRGRKPRPPEEKARIAEEKRLAKQAEKAKRRRARLDAEEDEELEEMAEEGVKKRRRGRQRKELTQEELDKREEARKAQYEKFKKKKQEEKEKRLERNKALREHRIKRKEEEKAKKEAFERRMQELKANFLDENSHLSANAEEGGTPGGPDESSQDRNRRFGSLGNHEMKELHVIRSVTAETLFEYKWPPANKNAEHYFLQEQICEYLNIKSFKRKYPNMPRRPVEVQERDFLVEMKIVNETQADLGLMAIPSSLVLDIMSQDYYDKYEEYMAVVTERKDRSMRQTQYNQLQLAKHKVADFVEKSVRSAAEWNKTMNAEKNERRRAYFDMQTFQVHHPLNGRGRCRVLQKPKLGHYPIALIPGQQFVDYYRKLTPSQLAHLPLNTTLRGPPKAGVTLAECDSSSSDDDDDSSSGSGSSSSSSDSSSSEDEVDAAPKKKAKVDDAAAADGKQQAKKPEKAIDRDVAGATCRICTGDRIRNKLGVPEKLLHCSKCEASNHVTCLGLHLELLQYVTNYRWECTECKVCTGCKDHSDEDKMLFCDLCDRGYHNYCVGLDTIPSGNWHCRECTFCTSCKVRDPEGCEGQKSKHKWVQEYKVSQVTGNKIYSHTMCLPCSRACKRNQFCPECNVVFGKEPKGVSVEYANCMVCSRQHHLDCVGQDTFICAACQKRTLAKTIGAVRYAGEGYPPVPRSPHPGMATPHPPAISQQAPQTPSMQTKNPALPSNNSALPSSPPPPPQPRLRPSMESGPVTCTVCKKVYKNRSTLYAHNNRDHGIKVSLMSIKH